MSVQPTRSQGGKAHRSSAILERACFLGASGAGLFLLSGITAFRQVARSNRPHELTFAPWAAVFSAVAFVLLVRALRSAVVAARAGAPRLPSIALVLVTLLFILVDLAFFVVSVTTAYEVLAQ